MRKKSQGGESLSGSLPVRLWRHVTIAIVIFLLCFVPLLFLIASASIESGLCAWFTRFLIFWFPLWSVFTVWVMLDADTLFRLVEPRPDPLGSKALIVSFLGLVNAVSACLFVGSIGRK